MYELLHNLRLFFIGLEQKCLELKRLFEDRRDSAMSRRQQENHEDDQELQFLPDTVEELDINIRDETAQMEMKRSPSIRLLIENIVEDRRR